MRNIWIVVLLVAIFGGVALFEYWTALQYPLVDYESGDIPILQVGAAREYSYFIEGELAGNYSFWVESIGPYVEAGSPFMGKTAYFTGSLTSVEHDGVAVEIETDYVFGTDLTPFEYRLNASLGGDIELITCLFDGWNVEGKIESGGSVVEQDLELPEDTVLIDTFMTGHWDLFFKQFTMEPGKRVRIDAYVPQTLSHFTLEFVSDKKHKTINIEGAEYECKVINVVELNLVLYQHEGNLIQLEKPDQEIVITERNVGS
jgi:hypothetical protein